MKEPLSRLREAALSFYKRNGNGSALLEVLVALTMLTIVVLTAILVRLTLIRQDASFIAEISGAAIIRQSAMGYQAGFITNGFLDKVHVESGEEGTISGILSTNSELRLERMMLDFISTSSDGKSQVNYYDTRLRLLPFWGEEGYSRAELSEPNVSTAPSLFDIEVESSDALKGFVDVGPMNGVPFGTELNLKLVVYPGYVFDRWDGDTNTIDNPYATNTTVYVDDDKQITALFH